MRGGNARPDGPPAGEHPMNDENEKSIPLAALGFLLLVRALF